MKLFAIIALFTFMLTGCAHQHLGQIHDQGQLLGQHVDVLVNRLGPPDGEQVLLGQRWVIWNSEKNVVLYQPTTTTHQGNVGGTSYSGTSTTPNFNNMHTACRFRVAVDDEYKITRTAHDGQQAACRRFAVRLSEFRE